MTVLSLRRRRAYESAMAVSGTNLLEHLQTPALIVSGGGVSFANAAAKGLLGAHIVGQDVRIAIRNPAAVAVIMGESGGSTKVDGLSSDTVHWAAGHRTSHGGTFGSLTNLRIGALVYFRGRTYVVVDYRLVNRFQPESVADWVYSTTPSVVLQTSASRSMVHVWRSVELVPVAPVVAVDLPPVPVPAG